ncbi:MAG: hypothetical protein JWQ35_288 [Bacteriovoracaceae bacterium]|nr:hypothetical protein [Bacteriovoracaceae bacterium]
MKIEILVLSIATLVSRDGFAESHPSYKCKVVSVKDGNGGPEPEFKLKSEDPS